MLWQGIQYSVKPFFNEFVVECPRPVEEINDYLLETWGVIGGYDLEKLFRQAENHLLVAVTEMNSREDIDILVRGASEVDHD